VLSYVAQRWAFYEIEQYRPNRVSACLIAHDQHLDGTFQFGLQNEFQKTKKRKDVEVAAIEMLALGK
jgi:hypothetical protein